MNPIQTRAMAYLTNGKGTTEYRMRALRELAELDFFGTSIEESASRVALQEYTESAGFACNDGILRFLDAAMPRRRRHRLHRHV